MSPQWIAVVVACILSFVGTAPLAFAQIFLGTNAYRLAPRTALVIGVSEVGQDSPFSPLANPAKDAVAVTKALRNLKFTVIAPHETFGPTEMTRRNIKLALYDFAQILRSSGGVGLIYFSGHGVQRADQIYLAPYGTYVRYDRDLEEEMLSLRLFYDAFKFARNKLNFVIIDACRNNPWDKSLQAFGEPVLAGVTGELGTVIRATATLSGMKALDGTDLSPYASAFIASLDKQDRELGHFFQNDVADKVAQLVKSEQTPTVLFAGSHDFIFHPTKVSFDREYAIYKNAMNTGNRPALEQLTTKFAGGYFVRAAQSALENNQLAPVAVASTLDFDVDTVVIQSLIVGKGTGYTRGGQLDDLRTFNRAIGDRSDHAAKVVDDLQTFKRTSGDRLGHPAKVADDLQIRSDRLQIYTDSVNPFWRAGIEKSDLRRVKVSSLQVAEAVPLQFHTSDIPGFEVLKEDTIAQVAKVVERASSSTTLDLVSYVPDGQGRTNDGGAGLVRQSNVLQAIKDAGFDASTVRLIERATKDPQMFGTIELVRSERVSIGIDPDTRFPTMFR